MRKLLLLGLVCALFVPSVAAPASAGRAKPVKTTLFMHGNYPVGEGMELTGFLVDGTYPKLDTTEPSAGPPKSQAYFAFGNDECVGNPLFPSWEGKLAGTITGDLKLLVNTVAAPSTMIARVWVDAPYMACTSAAAGTDAFVKPNLEQEVEVPAGANELEIVFKKVKLPVVGNIVVEFHQTSPRNMGRVVYDSPEFPSRVEFKCIPASGSKTCA